MNGESMLDGVMFGRLIAVLGLVIGMILLAGWALKRFGGGGLARAAQRSRRLALIEIRPLDPHHKLALVSRDGVEHLILLAANHSAVIETGIAPPAATEPEPRFRDALAEPADGRPVLRADDEDDRRDGAPR